MVEQIEMTFKLDLLHMTGYGKNKNIHRYILVAIDKFILKRQSARLKMYAM